MHLATKFYNFKPNNYFTLIRLGCICFLTVTVNERTQYNTYIQWITESSLTEHIEPVSRFPTLNIYVKNDPTREVMEKYTQRGRDGRRGTPSQVHTPIGHSVVYRPAANKRNACRLLRRRRIGPFLALLRDRVLDEFLHFLRLGEVSGLFAL